MGQIARGPSERFVAELVADSVDAIATGEDPIPIVAKELADRIDAPCSTYGRFDYSTGLGSLQVWPSEPINVDLMVAASLHVPHGHPALSYFLSGHAGIAVVSELVASRYAWRNSQAYSLMMQCIGMAETAGLRLDQGHDTLELLGFARPEDFELEQTELLRLVERPVVAIHRHGLTLAAWRASLGIRGSDAAGRCDQVALTPREAEVLYLLSTGLIATAIAKRMSISPRTVHKHLSNIYTKFRTHDRLSTVLRAQALGLLAPSLSFRESPGPSSRPSPGALSVD